MTLLSHGRKTQNRRGALPRKALDWLAERLGHPLKIEPRLAEICRRHHVKRLALFGSAIHGDFGPESDIDLLVEFEEGKTPGFDFVRLQQELSELFGREVDLHTCRSLSRYFRDQVVREAVTLVVSSK